MPRERNYIVDGTRSAKHREMHPRYLSSKDEVGHALAATNGAVSLWIAPSSRALSWLTGALAEDGRAGRGRLLLVDTAVDTERLLPLASGFDRVATRPLASLPDEELFGILALPNRDEYCIGGRVDLEAGVVSLVRGDLRILNVPLGDLMICGDGVKPDPTRFRPGEWGHSFCLGEYEASFDGVLYEHDPEYRRRLMARRRAEDRTFGASLRRLRIQRQLWQSEIPGLREKTVARIESGEVKRPHARTLALLAQALQVTVGELGSF